MKYLEPWESINGSPETLNQELTRELSAGHELYGLKFNAVATRCDRDDVLFKLEGHAQEYAVVHLSYSAENEPSYPLSRFYRNLESWIQQCMIPDNEEYT